MYYSENIVIKNENTPDFSEKVNIMEREEFQFFFPFRVRYSEIDGQMIVYNAHYLTYFDTAITEYCRALEFDFVAQQEKTGEDFHTVKGLVEYKAPIFFDDEIEVGVRTARIGNSSLTFKLGIYRDNETDLLASGEIVWVNTDQSTRKPSPVPSNLVVKLREMDGLHESQ